MADPGLPAELRRAVNTRINFREGIDRPEEDRARWVKKSAIGKLLLDENLITPEQLERALEEQRRNGGKIGTNLVKLGYISESTLAQFLGRQFNVEAIDLQKTDIDPECVDLVPYEIAKKYLDLPIGRDGDKLVVAMANPDNLFALDGIKFITSMDVEPMVCPESSLIAAIEESYANPDLLGELIKDLDVQELELVETRDEEEVGLTQLKVQVEEAPVVKLINGLVTDAVIRGASDIHIEPFENMLRVRYRIDGVLKDMIYPPVRMRAALISRVKILADLDIAERRLPQDGRIKAKIGGNVVDIRVSTVPTIFGEKIVMRILDKERLPLDLSRLGFQPKALEAFLGAIENPFGIVLVTGPTGSGKTTTLYSALTRLNTMDVNIMTVEDPVEYNLEGINQVNVRTEIGMNFARALRSFLRQDPNIIMVGEIRDQETAQVAIKAALTGHLVLSTVHTNDAASAVVRLIHMGIEPFLVSTACRSIVAQRLVRKICPNCREKAEYHPEALRGVGLTPEEIGSMTIYRGKGCPDCNETGYQGRIGLYEVMPVSWKIRELILENATGAQIKEQAVSEGMITLRDDGLMKIRAGLTTPEEVLKETSLE
jgi:type IV pilus assembly protein PilB